MDRLGRNNMTSIPVIYRVFFLYIEPVSTLIGAYYAMFEPQEYLRLTHASSAPSSAVPVSSQIVLRQLSNLYFLFAVNEALVLRASSDMKVWQSVLLGLFLADLGHLYSVRLLGLHIYWTISCWNAIDWGNIAFVYAGAAMRICFLSGLGLQKNTEHTRGQRRYNDKACR